TVGYEFAASVSGLFVDAQAESLFNRIYGRFTGDDIRYGELVYEMKLRQIREAFASELNVLVNMLGRLSEHDRHSRDFTNAEFREVLRETIACFAVYRTYVTFDDVGAADRDRRAIQSAIAMAARKRGAIDRTVFSFLEQTLLAEGPVDDEVTRQRRAFTMKLQQLTGPVMAKGVEDTAFYRFNRLVSLNEVGGDPSRFGASVEDFHRQNRARLRSWPDGLLAGSTHDTKRGEDVRAWISVLSEIPTQWRAALNRWSRLNRKLKVKREGILLPHRVDEYVIYQTLIGIWPPESMSNAERTALGTRLGDYMIKVAREASRATSWIDPDQGYEDALSGFIQGLLERRRSRLFLEDFEGFMERVRPAGMLNALGQHLLRLTAPGVPDIYQGTELWDDSLVDPDNRRPVDFSIRATNAQAFPQMASPAMTLANPAVKQFVTARTLAVRAAHPDLFARGAYLPLIVEGPGAEHVVAFARTATDACAIVIVPRLVLGFGGGASDAGIRAGNTLTLPKEFNESRWKSVFADATIPVERADDGTSFIQMDQALVGLGVALLISV
ncbi:MAG TPA: malto-oligosyltrehalose synthase, partial [Thermomicrobiales bacterium]|nr:malto-oligosyltrehalose synthase [Thermomicrobiales bacterium]